MRLIDADKLRSQVEAASYPMRSEMLRMIDAAPTAMAWHDAKTDPPTKDGEYLTFSRTNYNDGIYRCISWTKDLYKLDDYEFYDLRRKKDRSGWYDYDGEYGILTVDVDYWTERPEPPEDRELRKEND